MSMVIKNMLLLATALLLITSCCSSQSRSTANFEVVLPVNEYITSSDTAPYPVLIESKFKHMSPTGLVNVMNYGASGTGITSDDAAIKNAFAACKDGGGVLFPPGKTFLIQNLIRIPLDKNIRVVAYQATFKMADRTGYNAIAFEAPNEGYHHQLIWLGGLFDGNKEKQSWPGSPSGNNEWTVTQPNYGLITVRRAHFALIKDITLSNTVYDGVDLHECELGVFADSKAYGGADLTYSKIKNEYGKGHQATYFKCTRKNSQVVYFLNLDCQEGSIGIQYSTNTVNDSSIAVVNNCHFLNQSQDAAHFESCRKVIIYNSTISADNTDHYHADVHISNSCALAVIKKCEFRNGRIDFRNATSLQLGLIQNSRFNSTAGNSASAIQMFIHNATQVEHCTFSGITKGEQVSAKNIIASRFQNFEVATNALLLYKCVFNNGAKAVKNKGRTTAKDCNFLNITDTVAAGKEKIDDSDLDNSLARSVAVKNEKNKLIGYITK